MRFLAALALVAIMSVPAFAAFNGPESGNAGGFKGPVSGQAADTVAAAKTLADDSYVVLTGNIISKVAGSKDNYMFKDNTGEIIVDISAKRFQGRDVTPQNTVRLHGKVDKELGKTIEVDVKQLEILN